MRESGWNVVWDYVAEILREPSSHLVAALDGHRYVPDDSERAAWSVTELSLNAQIPKGRPKVKLTRPWAGKKPTYKTPTKYDPRSAERRARLAALF